MPTVQGVVKRVKAITTKTGKTFYVATVGNTDVSTWDERCLQDDGKEVCVSFEIDGQYKRVKVWVPAVNEGTASPTADRFQPTPASTAPATHGPVGSKDSRISALAIQRDATALAIAVTPVTGKEVEDMKNIVMNVAQISEQLRLNFSDLVRRLEKSSE